MRRQKEKTHVWRQRSFAMLQEISFSGLFLISNTRKWDALNSSAGSVCFVYHNVDVSVKCQNFFKTSQFKKVFKGDTAYNTQLKQQKSKRCYYLGARWHCGNVLQKHIDFKLWSFKNLFCTKSAEVVQNCMQMFNCFPVQERVAKRRHKLLVNYITSDKTVLHVNWICHTSHDYFF